LTFGKIKKLAIPGIISISVTISIIIIYYVLFFYPHNITTCNCVVFRMDDIQDFWLTRGQVTPLDLFLSKNQSLSLGLIMNYIGNDSKVIGKVREGVQKGLFELALHGWNHVDYTKLNEKDQTDSLIKANQKMQLLFGKASEIFIPPYDTFNNVTVETMTSLGLRILSSDMSNENKFNQYRSLFAAIGTTHHDEASRATIYHLPTTSNFKDEEGGIWFKIPIENILRDVVNSIKKYGYAVITLHPQNFVVADENGKFTNMIDENEIKDLSHLIDSILAKNIRIISFSKITGVDSSSSTFMHIAASTKANTNCSTGWYITRYFTPVETEYSGSTKSLLVDGITRNLYSSFLDDVKIEGWGKTKKGDYVGYSDGTYHSSKYPLDSAGNPLRIGDIATDPLLIPMGTMVKIPTLPSHWNNKIYTATDVGPAIKGKHIDVYIGEAKLVKEQTRKITGLGNMVCY
jgi:3D (Asp-Asp-Asp) domain-containing protein